MKKTIFFMTLLLCVAASAKVTVPAIFSDNAVLQKSKATAVFGKAAPGEKVQVSYAGISASAIAGKNGRWLVRLDLSKTDDKAHNLVIKGTNTLNFKNVITGEVWFCIGQSNMAFTVGRAMDAKENIAKSANPRIRQFRAHSIAAETPSDIIKGRWVEASPKTTSSFTAAGYYFARKINQETGRAFGLVNASWGGSSIESWISHEKLMKGSTPAVAKSARKELDTYYGYDKIRDAYVENLKNWIKKTGCIDDTKITIPGPETAWEKVPNMQRNIKGGAIVWFRREINVTQADLSYGQICIEIGRPNVPVEIYYDGKKVAAWDMKNAAIGRQFCKFVKTTTGKHVIHLRAYAYLPQFSFPRYHYVGKNKQSQTGWEMFRQRDLANLTAENLKKLPRHPGIKPFDSKTPTMIWNGLVHPILPLTMRGVLWYQGEQNAGATRFLYGDQIRALITDLRERFENPELPFYAAQLPNFFAKSADPNRTGNWVDIRVGQNKAMNMPNVAQAIIIDLGEAADIHPMNKVPVGERLAAIALHNDYGRKDLPCRSPEAVKAQRKGNSVIVTFNFTDGGLKAPKLPEFHYLEYRTGKKQKLVPNSPAAQVEGFALRAEKGKWYWADKAQIKGNTVIVSSAKVQKPAEIRYAWQNNPTCNLYNGAGFPAAPFQMAVK